MKKYLCMIIGMILIIYSVTVNFISSNRLVFGDIIVALGIICIIYGLIKDRAEKLKFYKATKGIVCFGLIILVIIEAMIITFPKKDMSYSDYIIVLGAGLHNGEVSLTLKGRLDAAIACFHAQNNKGFIVVSGGQGSDEKVSEAEAMKDYLIKNEVSENNIISEDKSRTTSQNLDFSKQKIEESSGKSINMNKIKIVTTDFHAFRASMLAKRKGYKEFSIFTSKTINYMALQFYCREPLAIIKSVIFDN